MTNYCAIDFGTSNSALAICKNDLPTLVALEEQSTNLPTALFYPQELEETTKIGRAAMQAYLNQEEGRLLRSIKSILGTSLMTANTEIAPGRVMNFTDIIADFLQRIKHRAEQKLDIKLEKVLLGRPAFFVDDDAEKDAQAQASLQQAAMLAGFNEVAFEFEPVAAALTFMYDANPGDVMLVADIGGGTSDFSVLHSSAEGSRILANYGVHVAGTDFDRKLSLATLMPLFGFGATNPNGRPVPNSIHYDLATWHKVNPLYTQKNVAALHAHRDMYGSKTYFDRLYSVLQNKFGHQLLGEIENAKIAASKKSTHNFTLNDIEQALSLTISKSEVQDSIAQELDAICKAALHTTQIAGLKADDISAIFFTGGSTGLEELRNALKKTFPKARALQGERFESVASGLGIAAMELWAPR